MLKLINIVILEVIHQLLWLGHAKCFPTLIKQGQYSALALEISSSLLSPLHDSNKFLPNMGEKDCLTTDSCLL